MARPRKRKRATGKGGSRPRKPAPPRGRPSKRGKSRRRVESEIRHVMRTLNVDRPTALRVRRFGIFPAIESHTSRARSNYVFVRTTKERRSNGSLVSVFKQKRGGKWVEVTDVQVRRAMAVARYWTGVRKLADNMGVSVTEAREVATRAIKAEKARRRARHKRGLAPLPKGRGVEWETVLSLLYGEKPSTRR